MVRVLHVVWELGEGGVEKTLLNLYRTIDRTRVQFDFLENPQDSEGRTYPYEDEVRALGGRVFRAPRFYRDYARYASFCREFFAAHREVGVVQGHNLSPCSLLYMREAHRSGAYLVAHAHNDFELPENAAMRERNRAVRRLACRYPDHFFACSEGAARFCFGARIAASPACEVVPNGRDLAEYRMGAGEHEALRRRLFPCAAGPVLVSVGRLVMQKNQAFAIDVLAEVLRREPGALLVILGEGYLRDDLLSHARSLGVASRVLLPGSVTAVADYLKAADVFVFPSLFEGLGTACVEAQATGLPTLVSECVPLTALCTDVACRLPLDAGAQAWADAAIAAWRRAEATGARRDRVGQVAAAGFDVGDVARRLTSFYELHGRRAGEP